MIIKAGKREIILDEEMLRNLQIQNSTLIVSKAGEVFARNRKTRKTQSLARIILRARKGQVVDHINRNPLDNRRCNLRIATHRQNMLNRIMKNSTGFMGVSINTKKKRYCGTYYTQNKRRCFYSPFTRNGLVLAAMARDKFIIENKDDDFAPLNFPLFKIEPFKSILKKSNLYKMRESL
jgi:hypothetical protein